MRGILFVFLGFAGLAAALLDPRWRFPGIGVAIVFFFFGGTAFSHATRIARSLRHFVKQRGRVEVWGLPLPAAGESVFEIDSILAVGAGLLIHLRAAPGGPRVLLKVAQPVAASVEGGRVEIGDAAYVSWGGTKLRPEAGRKRPALVLSLDPVRG